MTQDTRKDKRAKIVSLNVRYKSATVDEFIENHSYDVSKGGIFIKTPTPFPPGTLIKFEIRIAGDKAVIAGVGRVVWKREAGTASAERPAGMGVKFIKIDESSRQVIDRVVAEKGDAGAFASEQESSGPATEPGLSPFEGRLTPQPGVILEKAPRPAAKQTIMGIGTTSSPPPAMGTTASDLALTPAVGSPMFPTTNSEADMPPKQERTVMKQAAALLEEALKEAGGSMEDIGTNPLFDAAHASRDVAKSTLIGMPAAKATSAPRIETGSAKTSTAQSTPPEALKREAGAAAAVAKSIPPEATRESPSAKGPATKGTSGKGVAASDAEDPSPTSRQRKTDPPAQRKRSATAIVESEPPPRKKGGANPLIWVGLVVVLGGGIAFLYKDKLIDSSDATTTATATPTTPPAIVPTTPPVVPTASAAATTETTGAATTGDAAIATSDASVANADAGLATKDARTTTATGAAATAAPVVAPIVTAAPTPKPVVTAAPVATAAPTPKPVVTAAPTPKPVVTAAPTPKPKPTAADDDNPY